ncbi:MAG: hypothetical protein ACRD21_01410 [Vicinamibacteria bacterium]
MISPSNRGERGFSLIEITIALLLTLLVISSVFLLLQRGQTSFRREPEVTDMNASARAGLDRISQDLTVAGFNTPANMAVMWVDGGGITPDQITIVYADPDVPIARPKSCAGVGFCNTIASSSVLDLDPFSFSPEPVNFEEAFIDGMKLVAIQGPNGSPVCDAIQPGLVPLEVTAPPKCAGAGPASGPAACGALHLTHQPGRAGLDLPSGFGNDASVDCAVVGLFHVVQYRIHPLPPAQNPTLERRNFGLAEPWSAVSSNIENLQVQYAQGMAEVFEDVPGRTPMGGDLSSWVTRVRITVAGRSASANLEGASQGVFAAEDTHLRRSFTTTVSLRNQLSQAQQKAMELGLDSWN